MDLVARTLAMVPLLASLLGCAPPGIGTDDDDEVGESSSESSTSESSDSGESSSSESDDESTSESDELGFIRVDPDTAIADCDMILQDCPEGQKCVAYSDDGGGVWNATKCVPVTGDQHAGEPCHWDGISEGTDDCDASSVCWDVKDVDGELIGECTVFCSGTPEAPECPPMHACIISSGPVSLCVQLCDPLVQDCGEGLGCYWAVSDFNCIFTTEDIPTGEPCSFINDCAPGDFCTDATTLPDCAGPSCCTSFCDLELGDAQCGVLPGTACVAFFDLGMAPPGYEDVGICVLPP